MQTENLKPVLVNVVTGVIVVGVLIVGFVVFRNTSQTTTGTTGSIGEIASETVLIGADIETTVKGLEDLTRAVESSSVIFSTPAFRNLVDFSVTVQSQPVGRMNPFLPTDWKIKISEREKQTSDKKQTASVPEQLVFQIPIVEPVTTPEPETLLESSSQTMPGIIETASSTPAP